MMLEWIIGRAHSPTFPSLHLHHNSFSNPSVYVTAHSPTFPSLYLRHNSFSNPSVALPTSQLVLQPFRCFTYVTAHSPTLFSLLLRHNSYSNLSVASPTSQLILQPFFRFSYVTSSSLNSPGEPPMLHLSSFWRLRDAIRSPHAAGVPSLRPGYSIWILWWMKRSRGRFFSELLPFSPATDFIPPFMYTHLIHYISLAHVMVRQALLAGSLVIHRSLINGFHRISSPDPALCPRRVEDIFEVYTSLGASCTQNPR